jgi:putative transcriptional regulator
MGRTVCLIVEHTAEHAVGIVLNRPMAVDPRPFWGQLFEGEKQPERSADHFNFGGPKNGPILAIHSDSSLAEGGNNQGVYLSAQVDTLKKLAVMTPDHLRWFIGHVNWDAGQLEGQILSGSWHVVPAFSELVFANESGMWKQAIEWVGRSVLSEMTGVQQFPASPSLN